jgi:soluble lytic murein transglycosylase-like protein
MAREAVASPAVVVVALEVDTLPVLTQRLLQRGPLFSTEYLRRAFETRRATANASAPPAPAAPAEPSAETYARRYNIPVDLARKIIDSAIAEGLDPELGFRLVRVESVFRTNARGPSGSLGLTQLMPSTARAIDRTLRTDAQILDPVTNLRTGFRYLRKMIDRFDGNVTLGVLAYNRGEIAVDRALRAGRNPENGYSPKVLGTANNHYIGTGKATGN